MGIIAVNQSGYFVNHTKKASYVSGSDSPVDFNIVNTNGQSAYIGTTKVFGNDKDSGDHLHIVDFSDFKETGDYKIVIGEDASYVFTVGVEQKYKGLIHDAFNFFYQCRSGIDIEEKYISSGDKKAVSRAAGHVKDEATVNMVWDYDGPQETIDVTGGWYDAGDHGKYVVNGGISVWVLQNLYEVLNKISKGEKIDLLDGNNLEISDTVAKRAEAILKDGFLNIPESGDGLSDILSETRYEMDFLIKMMVTEGEYKDMAYHKVHDIHWTPLGTAPADDDMDRILMPPTTAATLNLSAATAQAARIWADVDAAYSDKMLDVAKRSYEAAVRHPDMLAPVDSRFGGGAYDDDDVTDEFYWAAAELYATTGEDRYLEDIRKNKYYLDVPFRYENSESSDVCGCFDWGMVATPGSLSLALVGKNRLKDDSEKLAASIIKAADELLKISQANGYGQPYTDSYLKGRECRGYLWGSNSYVCDNGLVLMYAYMMTGEKKYLEACVKALDYLLGNNPMNISYVIGHGTDYVKYPHHRFWAHQLREDRPMAPNGVLVGGPNSGMQCVYVQGLGWDPETMPPAKMYVDRIEAYSTNECTINWNGPLAALASMVVTFE